MKPIQKLLFALIAGALPIALPAGQAQAQNPEFTPELTTTLVDPYLAIQQALAEDNLDGTKKGAAAFLGAMKKAPSPGDAKEETDALIAPAKSIAEAADIAAARESFQPLTQEFATLLKHTGTTRKTPLYLIHCPMAFGNKGADWVQSDKTVANPYFGASMLRCGSVKAEIHSQGTHTGKAESDHKSHH